MPKVEADFTTQMLYCITKNGVQIHIADMGLNVLYDLIAYSAAVDAQTLGKASGKNTNFSRPQSVAEMTARRKLRG